MSKEVISEETIGEDNTLRDTKIKAIRIRTIRTRATVQTEEDSNRTAEVSSTEDEADTEGASDGDAPKTQDPTVDACDPRR